MASDLGTVEVSTSPQEKFREYLATQGQRMTRERAIVVDEVFATHEHFNADQLVGRLAQRNDRRRVSRSSIYRTLAQLEEAGLIRRVARQDEKDIFEHDYGYPQHDHFICSRCGTLIEFHDERIASVLEEVARTTGFRMEGHRMEVYGMCSGCAVPPASRPRKLNLL